jgi:pyruvate carboxylase
VVLGDRKPIRGRPGAGLKPLNLQKVKDELSAKLKHEAGDNDLYSHLMYPEVFAEYAKFVRDYGDVGALPTPPFSTASNPAKKFPSISKKARPSSSN